MLTRPPTQFMDNGGCGYVLKPEWMRRPGASLPLRPGRTLRVTVHSAFMSQGRNCCMFKDDIFVEVGHTQGKWLLWG